MGSNIPALSDAKWKRIEKLLPENKRDPVMIAALLFRHSSGCGLRDIAAWSGLTKSRLSDWDQALTADGTMSQIMKTLKLEHADARMFSSGGQRSWASNRKVTDGVTLLRFQNFREALRGR